MRCLPAGATLGSTTDGIVHSRTGRAEGSPPRVVEGALEVVHRGRDVDRPAVLRAGRVAAAGERAEAGQRGERDVDLHRAARVVDPSRPIRDVGREVPLADEIEEGAGRVGVRGDAPGEELAAVLEDDALRSSVADEDPGDAGARPDLRARRPRCAGDRLGEDAHPAADVAPHAARAVDLAHHVVEEHVGGAGGGGRGPGADDGVRRERRLERVRLEPAVEHVARRAGEDLHRRGAVGAEAKEARAHPREPQEIAGPPRERIRRRLEEGRLHGARDALELRLVVRQPRGVALRELRHLTLVRRGRGRKSDRPSGNGVNDEGSRARTS
jgi:hypothetical protein